MSIFVLPVIIAVFWLAYFYMPPPAGLSILGFRGLTDLWSDGVSISRDILDHHLALIKQLGYQTISFDDLERFKNHQGTLPPKSVILTFDASYETIYQVVYPLMRKHQLCGTAFVPATSIGIFTRLVDGVEQAADDERIRKMYAAGLELAVHGDSGAGPDPIEESLRRDIAALERTGCPFARVYSYPDKLSVKALLRNGLRIRMKNERISFAVRLGSGINDLGLRDPYQLKRVLVTAGDSPRDIEIKLIKGRGRRFFDYGNSRNSK